MNRALLALMLLLVDQQAVPAVPDAPAPASEDEIEAAVVEANEPRYVAPTTRDRIGRVWVPVLIDGKGPFRLVLDTGALNSAVTERTALKLGVVPGTGTRVMVRGSTGAAITTSLPAATLMVGDDLSLRTRLLPIVPHAFGGADGLLGVEGLGNHRIEIDFRRDRIHIARSRNRRAAPGYSTVRFLPDPMNLLVVQATIGGKKVRAIIDTGAHATVGNLALQKMLQRRASQRIGDTQIFGATGAVQIGEMTRLPQLRLGELVVMDMRATFADLYLFHTWKLGDEPALLVGMDVLGLVESLVIDYRRHELHIKPRS
jgi:predicted aspartyl protease